MASEIKLINGDCMEYMRKMKDKEFDLALVDPPYGIKQPAFRKKPKNKAARPKEYHNAVYQQKAPSQEYFNALFRVSAQQVIWGGQYYNNFLPSGRKWIFWDK